MYSFFFHEVKCTEHRSQCFNYWDCFLKRRRKRKKLMNTDNSVGIAGEREWEVEEGMGDKW